MSTASVHVMVPAHVGHLLNRSCEVVSGVQLLPPLSHSGAVLTKSTDSEIYCTCCPKIQFSGEHAK